MTGLRVYETVLYARDVTAAAAFYSHHLGLRALQPSSELMAVFGLGGGGVLLIFDPHQAAVPGRDVPSHGATGDGHIAFRVEPGELDRRRGELVGAGVAIDREVEWRGGGRSLYIRDPAGNSVEFVDADIWPTPDTAAP